MKYRMLGSTGLKVSEIGLGTWQVGGKWGTGFDANIAQEILKTAINQGVTFFDTADVYEAGASEAAVGKLKRDYGSKITIASKCGRRFQPHTSDMYTVEGLRKFVESSLKNTRLETIDLIQIHCPPTDIYYKPEIFDLFNKLKEEGKILNFGVSVERVEEALKAIEYDVVSTVQIIVNIFRQRPTELFFEQAKKKSIGVIARVPLASGLLTGKFSSETKFSPSDHRFFNRNGEVFDRGETFSGVPFDAGLKAIERIKHLFPEVLNLSQLSLRWILMFDAVSTIIPGASNVTQLNSNVAASDFEPLTLEEMTKIRDVYDEDIAPYVHHQW